VKLRGQGQRFYLPNFTHLAPRGTVSTSGVTVNGATAVNATSVTFAAAGAIKTLLAGDYFQVGAEMKMVVADAASDGLGAMTVTFEPPARLIFAHAAAVTFLNPTVKMMLKSADIKWSFKQAQLHGFSIDCVEDFS